jgi:hypothetical protein
MWTSCMGACTAPVLYPMVLTTLLAGHKQYPGAAHHPSIPPTPFFHSP